MVFNFGQHPFNIDKGDRIAQLICEKIFNPVLQQCDELDVTDRDKNGFGSSGQD